MRQRPLIDRVLGEPGRVIGLGNFVTLLGDSLFRVVNDGPRATGVMAKKFLWLADPFWARCYSPREEGSWRTS